jgi:hypothetical protein
MEVFQRVADQSASNRIVPIACQSVVTFASVKVEPLVTKKPAPSDSKWNGGGLAVVVEGALAGELVAGADATDAGKPESV